MKLITHIPPFLRNKYVLSLIGFLLWMLFFDRNDLITQFQRYDKLRSLRQSAAFLEQQITDAQQELHNRTQDARAYEKIAREKYYMKKDGEDLFIFEE